MLKACNFAALRLPTATCLTQQQTSIAQEYRTHDTRFQSFEERHDTALFQITDFLNCNSQQV